MSPRLEFKAADYNLDYNRFYQLQYNCQLIIT